jgi:hypothetical protein
VRSNREDPVDASPPCWVDHRHPTGCTCGANWNRSIGARIRATTDHPQTMRAAFLREHDRVSPPKKQLGVGSRCRCGRKEGLDPRHQDRCTPANASPIERRLRRDNRTLTPDPSVCRRAALDEGRVPEALPKGYPQHRGSFRSL